MQHRFYARYPTRHFLLLVALSCATVTAHALQLELHLFQQNSELPSAYVTALALDHDGRVLIGTIRGLARYDGHELQIFTVQDGLASNEISTLLVDSRNRVWIGHSDGKLSVEENDKLRSVTIPGLRKVPIIALYEDHLGNIWIGTLGQGVFILQGQRTLHLSTRNGLPGDAVFAILEDSQQRLWIGTENGIVILPSFAKVNAPKQWTKLTRRSGLPDNWIRCLTEDSKGTIWIGTRNNGLASYQEAKQLQGKNPWRYFSPKTGYALHSFITKLLVDPSGKLWIGTYGDGVATLVSEQYLTRYRKQAGMPNLYVMDLLQDREGQIWIATFGGGLVIFRPTIITRYTVDKKLPSNNVLAILDDHREYLWIATDNGLAKIRYPVLPGHPLNITVYPPRTTGGELVTTLLQDSTGQCWGITEQGSIYALESDSLRLAFHTAIAALQAAFIDPSGTLWLLDQSRKVLAYTLAGMQLQWLLIPERYEAAQWLGYHPTYGLLVLTKTALLQLRDNQFHPLLDTLGELYPTVVTTDIHRNIWIGTNGQGLLRIAPDGTVQRYDDPSQMVSNIITALWMDTKTQNLWIGTNRGFARYAFQNQQFYPYGPNEGFPSIEINLGALTNDRYGNIWMGSVTGAYSYRLKEAERTPFAPDIVIKQVKIVDLDSTIQNGGHIPYQHNNLLFEFVGVSLRNPQALRYSYMLVGIDSVWSSPTAKHSALYTDLPPGSYIFKVKAGYLYGQWSKHPATFQFTILPAWWQTEWFYLSIAASLVLSLGGIFWYRSRRIAKMNQWLEQEVTRRTAALVAKTQELEMVIQELEKAKRRAEAANEAKMKFLAKVTHELRSPLNIILGFTRRLLRKQTPPSTELSKALDAIYRNAETLLAHINSILQYARMETQKSNNALEKVDLSNLIHQLVEEFRPIVHQGVRLMLDLQTSDLSAYGNIQMIDQILKNLLSNAIRFTERGEIRIRVSDTIEKNIPYLAIDIQDTGKGIAEDDQAHIFEPFHQAHDPKANLDFGGIGLGLAIAKQFATEMRGDLRLLHSELGKGSTFRLLLRKETKSEFYKPTPEESHVR